MSNQISVRLDKETVNMIKKGGPFGIQWFYSVELLIEKHNYTRGMEKRRRRPC